MVDIDRQVIDVCKKYLPDWNQGSFDNPKVELYHMDARKYLEENTGKWDVIFLILRNHWITALPICYLPRSFTV